VDVISYMLERPICGIIGLILNGRHIIRDQLFFNNMVLILQGYVINLEIKNLLYLSFHITIGAKINWAKSIEIWFSKAFKDIDEGCGVHMV
jgi:hypothetical protein